MSKWSSYKKDQLIMEGWRNFLNEVETSDFGAYDVSGVRTASPDSPKPTEQRNIKLRNVQQLTNRVLDRVPSVDDLPDTSDGLGKKDTVTWINTEKERAIDRYDDKEKFKRKMVTNFDNTKRDIEEYLNPPEGWTPPTLPSTAFPLGDPPTKSIYKSLGVYEVSMIQKAFNRGVLGDLADIPCCPGATGPDDTYKNRALKNLEILKEIVKDVEIL